MKEPIPLKWCHCGNVLATISGLCLIGLFMTDNGWAQPGSLDPDFRPNTAFDSSVVATVKQSDGKIVLVGNFTIAGSEQRGRIARLNGDGALDTTFGDGLSGVTNNTLSCLALQSDGKILIGGSFSFVNGLPCNFLCRLNTNGSLDSSFEAGLNGSVSAISVQNDGKILIGGNFLTVDGVSRVRVARLRSDGTLDTTFGAGLAGAGSIVRCLALQDDEKILIGGDFSTVNNVARSKIARLNTDGSLDTTFLNGLGGANNTVYSMALQIDGKVLIGGTFTVVNGATRNRIARLNTDGSRDTSFGVTLAGADSDVRSVVAQNNGQVLIGGLFSSVNGTTRNRIARLNNDGTLDANFANNQAAVSGSVLCMTLTSSNNVVVGGGFTQFNGSAWNYIARLNSDGGLDTGFGNGPLVPSGTVTSIAAQSDGKLIVGQSAAQSGKTIVRLKTNGLFDPTFALPLTNLQSSISAIAVQTNDMVLLGGSFDPLNGVSPSRIARLDNEGNLDESFGYGLAGTSGGIFGSPGDVYAIALQSDGKILIGGPFIKVHGADRSQIARLNTDGSLDASFSAYVLQDGYSAVRTVAVQSDNKIVVGGSFGWVNTQARYNLVRVDENGSTDTNFLNGLAGPNGAVNSLVVQTDGKILIGGAFSTVNGIGRNGIARLNPNGSLDTNFTPHVWPVPSGIVRAIALQDNGKILLGGYFNLINDVSRTNIVRLNSDGSLDQTFLNGLAGANNSLNSVVVQSDGNILIGGAFTLVNNASRFYLARLLGDGMPAPPPTLSINHASPNTVGVLWPFTVKGFILQHSTNATSAWGDVGQPPIEVGTNWSVNLPATNFQQLFRLRKL